MYVPALILEASYSIEGEKEKKKKSHDSLQTKHIDTKFWSCILIPLDVVWIT